MEMNIPKYIIEIQNILKINKYKSYLVGGCIRDKLLGKIINDYDLTTNCDIENLKIIFKDYNIINNNGEKHNTITLHIDNDNIEITSFKCNNDENISIETDLSHRDITINSIAYDGDVIDPYNGIMDLNNKIIRCVLNPNDRIKEDPLRILRILRFSSILDFKIEENTKNAIMKNYQLLLNVSKERIKKELDYIIIGKNVKNVLLEYKELFILIIPELKHTINFNQCNPHHKNNLYVHLVNTCENTKPDHIIRLAAILHDIKKPECMTLDKNNIGHFYMHAYLSYKYSMSILKELKYSNDEIKKISYLIKYHDTTIYLNKKSIKKILLNTPNQNIDLFYMLIDLKNADKKEHINQQLLDLNIIKKYINEILMDNDALKITDLSINGNDIKNMGFYGKEIGIILKDLLKLVIEEKIYNSKEDLINYVKTKYLN